MDTANTQRITDEEVITKLAERGFFQGNCAGMVGKDVTTAYVTLRTARHGDSEWMRFARGGQRINGLTTARHARIMCKMRCPDFRG